jgi:hypothetical protein
VWVGDGSCAHMITQGWADDGDGDMQVQVGGSDCASGRWETCEHELVMTGWRLCGGGAIVMGWDDAVAIVGRRSCSEQLRGG